MRSAKPGNHLNFGFVQNGAFYREEKCTSRSHGNQISGCQQSFLTERAIGIVERWKKSLGYRFAPDCNHAKDSHACQCIRFFFLPYLQDHGL